MGKIKRIIAVILIGTLLCTMLSSCGMENFRFGGEPEKEEVSEEGKKDEGVSDLEDSDKITRGQWAKLLGDQFGLTSCVSIQPYYDDVDASNEYFVYIQSGAEWEVYSKDENSFMPDEYATTEFILETSMRAAEVTKADTGTKDMLEIAKENGLVDEEKIDKEAETVLNAESTVEYAKDVVKWAKEEYQNKEFEVEENIVYKEEVKDKTEEIKISSDGTFTTDDESIKVGDVILADTKDDSGTAAVKVMDINSQEDGKVYVVTTQPEFGEVFEDVDVSYIAGVTDDVEIETEEGITATLVSTDYELNSKPITSASTRASIPVTTINNKINAKKDKTKDEGEEKYIRFSVELDSNAPKLTNKIDNGLLGLEGFTNLTQEEERFFKQFEYEKDIKKQFKNAKSAKLKVSDKYKEGVKITGEILIKNLRVQGNVETEPGLLFFPKITELNYKVMLDVETSLEVEGKIEEEIKIGVIVIPINALTSVEVEICAIGDINGKLSYTTKVHNVVTGGYSEKKGHKLTADSTKDKSFEGAINVEIGFGAKATFEIAKLPIIDVEIETTVEAEVSGELTQVMKVEGEVYKYNEDMVKDGKGEWALVGCGNCKICMPKMKVSIGASRETLANKLGLKMNIKIFDESDAIFKSDITELHFETGKGWVSECTYDDLEEYEKEETTPTQTPKPDKEDNKENNSSESILGGGMLNISKYGIALEPGTSQDVEVISMPDGYNEDDLVWSVTDETVAVIASANGKKCGVSAVGTGITQLNVSTSDGKHSISCSVMVRRQEDLPFTPLD